MLDQGGRPMGSPNMKGAGNGTLRPNGRRQSVILLDPDQHAEIQARADQHGVSFAEEVRTLLEWGLEAEHIWDSE